MADKIDWAKAASLPRAELERLLEADHDEIDDNPELTDEQLAQARPGTWRPDGWQPARSGPGERPAEVLITVRVEPDTLAAFQASGPGWEGRVSAALAEAARKLPKA